MNMEPVPAQLEAHAAYKARRSREAEAVRRHKQKPRHRPMTLADIPTINPIAPPVLVDHNAHVLAFRSGRVTFDRIKHDALVLCPELRWEHITSNRRFFEITKWRQAIMHAAHCETGLSTVAIGRLMGNKDHTTVLHAVRKVKEDIADGRCDKLVGPTGIVFYVRRKYIA